MVLKKNLAAMFVLLSLVLGSSEFGYGGLNDGLVAYYPFNNDASDKSGNGNHGTIYGAIFVNGISGMGLEFSGSESTYVEVQHSDSLTPVNAVTISAWTKSYNYSTWHSCLVYKAGEEPTNSGFKDRCYTIWSTDQQGVHFTSTPEGASSQIPCNAPNDLYASDAFTHIVGVIDAINHIMAIYINGEQVQTCPYDGDEIRGGSYPLRIGAPFKTLSDQSGLDGVLDEIRIYNRALSEEEIRQLYDHDSSGDFTYPVDGIKYSSCPANSGTEYDPNNPATWYTMVWSGKHTGNAEARCESAGGHPGVDILPRTEESRNIMSIAKGTVIESNYSLGFGYYVIIEHQDDYVTFYSVYAHLEGGSVLVGKGDLVEPSMPIGKMGASGYSSGVHLHFQIDKQLHPVYNKYGILLYYKPYWTTYTANVTKGFKVQIPYPVPNDGRLSIEQLREAAANVRQNTYNPIWLIEHLNSREVSLNN